MHKKTINDYWDVQAFKKAIEKGEYPEKCLRCYEMGLMYCGFWNINFNCEPHRDLLKEIDW